MNASNPATTDVQISGHDLASALGFVLAVAFVPLLAGFLLSAQGGPFTLGRHGIYALPALLAMLLVFRGRVQLDGRAFVATVLFGTAALLATVTSGNWTFISTRDALIIGSYFAMFAPFYGVDDRALRFLSLGLVGVFGLAVALNFGGVSVELNVLESTGFFETPVAFPGAVLALYLTIRRRYGLAAILIIVTFLSFKRVAMVGLAYSAAVYVLLRLLGTGGPLQRMSFLQHFALALMVAPLIATAIFLPEIVQYALDTLDARVSYASTVLQGRLPIITYLREGMLASDTVTLLFGHGMGQADAGLYAITSLSNPHNDFLKIFFDYGVVGGLMVLGAFWFAFARNAVGATVMIFGFTLMISDNVFIYFFYQFVAFMALRHLETDWIQQNNEVEDRD